MTGKLGHHPLARHRRRSLSRTAFGANSRVQNTYPSVHASRQQEIPSFGVGVPLYPPQPTAGRSG